MATKVLCGWVDSGHVLGKDQLEVLVISISNSFQQWGEDATDCDDFLECFCVRREPLHRWVSLPTSGLHLG